MTQYPTLHELVNKIVSNLSELAGAGLAKETIAVLAERAALALRLADDYPPGSPNNVILRALAEVDDCQIGIAGMALGRVLTDGAESATSATMEDFTDPPVEGG